MTFNGQRVPGHGGADENGFGPSAAAIEAMCAVVSESWKFGYLENSVQRDVGYGNFVAKIWSAVHYVHSQKATDPNASITDEDEIKLAVNKWIVGETAITGKLIREALKQYHYHSAAYELYWFVSKKFCEWYIEISRPTLESDDFRTNQSKEKIEETRKTLAWVMNQCLILLYPFMPFVVDEIWGTVKDQKHRLIFMSWPTYTESDDVANKLVNCKIRNEINWLIRLVDEIRFMREQFGIPLGPKMDLYILRLNSNNERTLRSFKWTISRMARVNADFKKVRVLPKGCVTVTVECDSLGLSVADAIDVDAEYERLKDELMKSHHTTDVMRSRIESQRRQGVPKSVIDKMCDNLLLAESRQTDLLHMLNRIGDLV